MKPVRLVRVVKIGVTDKGNLAIKIRCIFRLVCELAVDDGLVGDRLDRSRRALKIKKAFIVSDVNGNKGSQQLPGFCSFITDPGPG